MTFIISTSIIVIVLYVVNLIHRFSDWPTNFSQMTCDYNDVQVPKIYIMNLNVKLENI